MYNSICYLINECYLNKPIGKVHRQGVANFTSRLINESLTNLHPFMFRINGIQYSPYLEELNVPNYAFMGKISIV